MFFVQNTSCYVIISKDGYISINLFQKGLSQTMKHILFFGALLLSLTLFACGEGESSLEVDKATLHDSYSIEAFEYESIQLIYTENGDTTRVDLDESMMVSLLPEEEGMHLAVAEYEGERVKFTITFE